MTTFKRLAVIGFPALLLTGWALVRLQSHDPSTESKPISVRAEATSSLATLTAAPQPRFPSYDRTKPVPDRSDGAPEAPEQEYENVDPAHELAELQTSEQEFLERHAASPVDASWRRHWEQKIGDSLESLKGESTPFDVVSLECRSGTCVAELGWKDYNSAGLGSSPILHRSALECQTSVLLAPPENLDAEYHHKVLYSECSDRRSE